MRKDEVIWRSRSVLLIVDGRQCPVFFHVLTEERQRSKIAIAHVAKIGQGPMIWYESSEGRSKDD